MTHRLPHGWTSYKLSQVATWGSGGTPKRTNPAYFSGQVPWIIIGDLTDGPVFRSTTTITEEGLRNSSAKWVEPGSVLVAMYGSIGKLGIAETRLTTNQAIAFAVPHPGLLTTKYLFYYLLSARSRLVAEGKGGTQQNISQTVLKSFPIPIAPLPQQEAIIEEIEKQFTRLDAAVASLRRIQVNLKRYRAAILQAAVTGQLLKHPDTLPDVETLEPTGPKAGTPTGTLPLPNGWEWRKLGDLLTSLKNGIFVSRPSATPPGTPILRISAVRPMSLNTDDIRYADPTVDGTGFFLERDDLLFTRYSGNPEYVGACARVVTLHRPVLHPDKLIRARARSDLVISAFLEIAVAAGYSRETIRRRAKTTAGQTGVSGADLKSVPVPLPPLAEQAAIVAEVERRLSFVDELDKEAQSSFKRAERLRQSVLAAAFQGRLTPAEST